jgi:hypothetical protein
MMKGKKGNRVAKSLLISFFTNARADLVTCLSSSATLTSSPLPNPEQIPRLALKDVYPVGKSVA